METAAKSACQADLYGEIVEAAILTMNGDEPLLAARLGVEAARVHSWRTGEQHPALEEFISLLDVLAEAPWRTGKLHGLGL